MAADLKEMTARSSSLRAGKIGEEGPLRPGIAMVGSPRANARSHVPEQHYPEEHLHHPGCIFVRYFLASIPLFVAFLEQLPQTSRRSYRMVLISATNSSGRSSWGIWPASPMVMSSAPGIIFWIA